MSLKTIPDDLVSSQEARALRYGPEVARAVDVRAIASAVTDEARHGKAGTARSPSGVFIWRVGKALDAARDRCRIREQQTRDDLERYAELWVNLLRSAVEQGSSPSTIAAALCTFRKNGFPKLNPLIAAKLDRLGAHWSPPALTPAAESETPKRSHKRSSQTTEGRRRAATHG